MSLLATRLLRLGQGLATFVSILALNIFILLLILKLDTTGLLATTSWLAVVSPLATSILAGFVAWGLNRLQLNSEEMKPLLSKANHNDWSSLAFLADRMTPSSIGRFYEADIFMRLLQAFCLAFLTVVGFFVQYNECRCQTPVKILIQSLTCLYGLRALLQYFNISFNFARFLQMVAAISSYHDVPNAKRLSDLANWHAMAWTRFQRFVSFLRTFAAIVCILLAVLSTYRVQNDDCMSECPDLFTQSQHFLFAVYVCEVFDFTRKLVFNWYATNINLTPLLARIRLLSPFYTAARSRNTDKQSKPYLS